MIDWVGHRTGLTWLQAVTVAMLVLLAALELPALPATAGSWKQPSYVVTDGVSTFAEGRQGIPPPPRAEFVVSVRYATILGRDFAHIFASPVRWQARDWTRFSVLSGAVGGTALLLDKPIRRAAQRNRGDFTNALADRFNNFGFNYPTWILAGFYLTGLVFGDNTAQEVGLDGLAATLIASNIVTPSLKRAVGRYRPYYEEGPFTFDSFSGHDSWPSGHATRAFVTAAVIASHYHQTWVKVTAYGIAALVAFARVNYDVHWASDVLAGAIIGISIGHGVVKYNFQLRYGH